MAAVLKPETPKNRKTSFERPHHPTKTENPIKSYTLQACRIHIPPYHMPYKTPKKPEGPVLHGVHIQPMASLEVGHGLLGWRVGLG